MQPFCGATTLTAGIPDQAWIVYDKGDNSNAAFVNDRSEIYTENILMTSDKWAGGYVDVSAGDAVIQTRVQQISIGDEYIAGLSLRGDPVTDSGYSATFSHLGNLHITKRTNGADAEILNSYMGVPGVDATDFQLKFMAMGTNLYAKVWTTGTLEPSGWQLTATDSDFTDGVAGIGVGTGSSAPGFGYFSPARAAFDNVILMDIPAAALPWIEDFDGGVPDQVWEFYDQGDNTEFAFDNNQFEIYTENALLSSRRVAGGYVDIDAGDAVIQAHIKQINVGDNYDAGVILRGNPAVDTAYIANIVSDTLFIIKSINSTDTVVLNSIALSGVDATDFIIKFAVVENNLFAKAWNFSGAEPAEWLLQANDDDYESGVGGVLLGTSNSGGLFSPARVAFDDVSMSPLIISAGERQALIDLYNSTNGDSWTDNSN
jgi:hypothetical protein